MAQSNIIFFVQNNVPGLNVELSHFFAEATHDMKNAATLLMKQESWLKWNGILLPPLKSH